MTRLGGARILLGVTGSVAAYKAADLTVRLREAGASVRVILTEAAQRFITPLTFEALSREPVLTGLWERTQHPEPVHVNLAEWADLLVIAPATADAIARVACGLADELLYCMALAVSRPPVMAPAMNDAMYRHPSVQENLERLRSRGCIIVGPVEGRLATGKTGIGRLAPIEDIVAAIETALCESAGQ